MNARLIATLLLLTSTAILLGQLPQSPAGSETSEQQYREGLRWLKGEGVEKDAAKALRLMQSAADAGHADAAGALGFFHANGIAVPKDDVEARKHFAVGTEKGSSRAQANLGRFLVEGRGGEKDVARGIELLKSSRRPGFHEPSVILGEIYSTGAHHGGQPDFIAAYEALVGVAHAGNAQAQNMIGVLLLEGRIPGEESSKGQGWLEKSAAQGEVAAYFALGRHLYEVAQSREEKINALSWLMKAEDAGDLAAQNYLKGVRGLFTTADYEAAGAKAREKTIR